MYFNEINKVFENEKTNEVHFKENLKNRISNALAYPGREFGVSNDSYIVFKHRLGYMGCLYVYKKRFLRKDKLIDFVYVCSFDNIDQLVESVIVPIKFG